MCLTLGLLCVLVLGREGWCAKLLFEHGVFFFLVFFTQRAYRCKGMDPLRHLCCFDTHTLLLVPFRWRLAWEEKWERTAFTAFEDTVYRLYQTHNVCRHIAYWAFIRGRQRRF